MHRHDTIAAISTAPGIAGIAVIRVSGPEALPVTQHIFKGKKLSEQPSHTVHFGKIMEGEELIDEVVVALFRAPHSYTREEVVEISCHGSVYVQQKILQLLLQAGARLALPGEFTQRAFLNGALNLSEAEAVADLIASESAATHRLAMRQMRGGYTAAIRALREALVGFAALVELELDFSEEDVQFANRRQLTDLVARIDREVLQLLESFRMGNAIRRGVTTVIAGLPNAGKSTLLNALLQEERAIVSPIPGTTRDTIEEILHIGGIPFRLTDTAGIRESADTIEQAGVQRTLEKVKEAVLVIYLFDVNTQDPQELQGTLVGLQTADNHLIPLGNKTDLLASASRLDAFRAIPGVLFLSAAHEPDLEPLKRRLLEAVAGQAPRENDLVVSNVRHAEAFRRTHELLISIGESLSTGLSGELLSQQIREALGALGSITGEVSADEILGAIFVRFCIGK